MSCRSAFRKALSFIHDLKPLLFEVALLVVFIAWLWNAVRHSTGF